MIKNDAVMTRKQALGLSLNAAKMATAAAVLLSETDGKPDVLPQTRARYRETISTNALLSQMWSAYAAACPEVP